MSETVVITTPPVSPREPRLKRLRLVHTQPLVEPANEEKQVPVLHASRYTVEHAGEYLSEYSARYGGRRLIFFDDADENKKVDLRLYYRQLFSGKPFHQKVNGQSCKIELVQDQPTGRNSLKCSSDGEGIYDITYPNSMRMVNYLFQEFSNSEKPVS